MNSARSSRWRFFFYASLVILSLSVTITGLVIRWAKNELDDPRHFHPHTLSALRDQNYQFTIENYGYKYVGKTGDLVDDCILAYGAWEKDSLFFLRDYVLRSGGADSAFLDVGAYTGEYSLFMSRHVKEVHAFEPFPPSVKRFRKNIDLNGFKNITLHAVGLGEKEATLPYFVATEENPGSGTFREGVTDRFRTGKPYGNLRIVVGDEWLKSFPLPSISSIKIDVEGFEEAVLKGLRRTLEKHRPVVLVEVSNPPLGTITSLSGLKDLFPEQYDFLYVVRSPEGDIAGKYELKDFSPVAAKNFSGGGQVDLVAFPQEKGAVVPRQRAGADHQQP